MYGWGRRRGDLIADGPIDTQSTCRSSPSLVAPIRESSSQFCSMDLDQGRKERPAAGNRIADDVSASCLLRVLPAAAAQQLPPGLAGSRGSQSGQSGYGKVHRAPLPDHPAMR